MKLFYTFPRLHKQEILSIILHFLPGLSLALKTATIAFSENPVLPPGASEMFIQPVGQDWLPPAPQPGLLVAIAMSPLIPALMSRALSRPGLQGEKEVSPCTSAARSSRGGTPPSGGVVEVEKAGQKAGK